MQMRACSPALHDVGGAVRRFVMLRQHEKTGAVEIEGRGSKAVSIASHVGRAVLVCLLAVSVVACAGFTMSDAITAR